MFRARRRAVVERGFTPEASSSEGVETPDTLKRFEHQPHFDPNLPTDEIELMDASLTRSDAEKSVNVETNVIEDDSQYSEVRAAVRNYDVDLPANTIRAWVIGLILCTVGSAVNMLFSLRNPSVTITTYVIQLVAYPIGLGWDLIFPDRVFDFKGVKFNFKPGKFNFKEHVVVVAMSNAAYGGGVLYATDVLLAQQVFLWPAAMIWPGNLVNATLFHVLHDDKPTNPAKTNGWRMDRHRWFLYVMGGGFVWYFFPGWIFQGLSYFNILCWALPNSVIVNKLFGGFHGYGILPTTLDWSVISGYALSPLIPPFHAIANTVAGVLIFFVIVSAGLHFSGTWYADYFVVQSSDAFDNTGAKYNVSKILNDQLLLDEEAYHAYSPIYLSTQFALCYGLSFAAVAAVIIHVALYHGPKLKSQFKQGRSQEDDVHMHLMKKYKDLPDWWYMALFVVMVGLSFAVCTAWPTGFPAWAYVICIIIPIIWTIPIGIIQATTNIQIGLNVLTEFIIGYLLPGHPLAMMKILLTSFRMFKNYGSITMQQALYFVQDLKLGHYMKVPPRTMFWSQLAASVWSAIVQITVMNWALGSIPDICSDQQTDGYTCPGGRLFFSTSVIWSTIGPARIFSGNATYSSLQWFWLVGAVSPVIAWFLARRYPKSMARYINMPLVFGGSGWIPPATVYSYLCWGSVGLLFNYFIKRRFNGWWLHYNYITSAALDCGLIISTLLIFFTLYLTSANAPRWYGNYDVYETLDQRGLAIKSFAAAGETFGPTSWP
ncbi:hypothetical protein FHL15_000581 [Xylaria flabelliformis]|uniref:OPT family small oligopeptide transporter n=1 Tax=Xylaria flabelliformis TaxID=2512241 RepID=A0A553IE93_9PEZI|nr:hypothetical protein FHL15_000581 [Xylaria flabelliformis]